MTTVKSILEEMGYTLMLLWRTLRYLPSLPRSLGRLLEMCLFMGYSTMGIVTMLSFSIGAVLALQTGDAIRQFGVSSAIGNIVGL